MKLILFIHGLGGDRATWGRFEELIAQDSAFDSSYKVEFYEYKTSLLHIKGILPFFGRIGKALAILAPKLPKIQDVAQLLRSDIESKYSEYHSIYLAVHSMGGLVALKYITHALNHNHHLKIKKLLLFDVPSHGSHLAHISALYRHTQIIQLDKSSDFLDDLNNSNEFKTIEKALQVQCLICQEDIVVDKASAKAHYSDVYELNKTHSSITKPVDSRDESYLFFRNFMLDRCYSGQNQEAFVENIVSNLSNEIYVLLHQKGTHIASIVDALQSQTKQRFKEHFYHFVTPQNTTKAKYYHTLGTLIHQAIKNATEFQEAMGEIAKNNKVLLYINNFEDNSSAQASEMATAIRNLKDTYPNFHAILIGKAKLAQMSYQSDSLLSPLNNAIKKIFPNNAEPIPNDIRFIINALESYEKEELREYLNREHIGDFDINDRLKMKLFWSNIVSKNSKDKLCWSSEETKEILKSVL
ncbi:MAG: hypothetical protein KU38_12960 [Sulfurovum sp. FS08-3]|nr:MAG: hypothetical protein KU38_12960 [Sulfurovum sp. FS08-3]